MLLFVPFRNEDELMRDGETPEEAFERQVLNNTGLSVHYQRLQVILEAQGRTAKINEAREQPDEKKVTMAMKMWAKMKTISHRYTVKLGMLCKMCMIFKTTDKTLLAFKIVSQI